MARVRGTKQRCVYLGILMIGFLLSPSLGRCQYMQVLQKSQYRKADAWIDAYSGFYGDTLLNIDHYGWYKKVPSFVLRGDFFLLLLGIISNCFFIKIEGGFTFCYHSCGILGWLLSCHLLTSSLLLLSTYYPTTTSHIFFIRSSPSSSPSSYYLGVKKRKNKRHRYCLASSSSSSALHFTVYQAGLRGVNKQWLCLRSFLTSKFTRSSRNQPFVIRFTFIKELRSLLLLHPSSSLYTINNLNF